jgi:hypothetical protein
VKKALFVLMMIFLAAACKGPLSKPAATDSKSLIHNAVVSEVIHAGGYTYLKVTEKRKETWLAVPAMEANMGDKLTYTGGLEMKDFQSKELNRTFPNILFLEGVNMDKDSQQPDMNAMKSPGPVKTERISITIEPVEGCVTIARLYEARSEYSGKTIKVKGKVTKFNAQIMGKNWIHIQDGTDYKGDFDLAITSDMSPAVGDIATFEGKIALNKDFGYGYLYDLIMEEGRLVK